MSDTTVRMIVCDGQKACVSEFRPDEEQPVGWITIHKEIGDYHLCSICATVENFKRLRGD